MKKSLSVIIPVYNAAKFLPKAVEAAIQESEVGEIILVEDASPDDSLEVCKELAAKYDKISLIQHSDKKNHGCGASRNLGIANAKFNYICLADADNFILPNRFKLDKKIFAGGVVMIIVGVIIGVTTGQGPTGHAGMTEEETRFGGVKRECGLHDANVMGDGI